MSEITSETKINTTKQSESLKRAKAKYFQKKMQDPEFRIKNNEKAKKYYEDHKEKCYQKIKECKQKQNEKMEKEKIESIKLKILSFDAEDLAKILIKAKKLSLLE